jgi:hypothetical protein
LLLSDNKKWRFSVNSLSSNAFQLRSFVSQAGSCASVAPIVPKPITDTLSILSSP